MLRAQPRVEPLCSRSISSQVEERSGLRVVFFHAIKQGKKLIKEWRDEYGLLAAIKEARNGKINAIPLPLRFIYRSLLSKAHEEKFKTMTRNPNR